MIPMTRSSLTAALSVLLFTGASAFAQSSAWTIDTNQTQIDFQIRRVPVSNVRGLFSRITGTVNWDEKNPSKSSVQVTIPTRVPSRPPTTGATQISGRPSFSTSRSIRP
jgi:polyisoprenoid-binding protein YceI